MMPYQSKIVAVTRATDELALTAYEAGVQAGRAKALDDMNVIVEKLALLRQRIPTIHSAYRQIGEVLGEFDRVLSATTHEHVWQAVIGGDKVCVVIGCGARERQVPEPVLMTIEARDVQIGDEIQNALDNDAIRNDEWRVVEKIEPVGDARRFIFGAWPGLMLYLDDAVNVRRKAAT